MNNILDADGAARAGGVANHQGTTGSRQEGGRNMSIDTEQKIV